MNEDYRRPTDDPRIAQTRELILGAARSLLLDEGQEAVTPTRLTEITGISRSTIYRHWSGPSDIIFEATSTEADEPVVKSTGDVRRNLTLYLEEMRRMLESPRATLLATQIESAEHHQDSRDVLQRIAEHRRDLIKKLLDHRDDDFGAHHALIIGPLIFRRFMAQQEIDDDLLALVVEAYMQARTSDSPTPKV